MKLRRERGSAGIALSAVIAAVLATSCTGLKGSDNPSSKDAAMEPSDAGDPPVDGGRGRDGGPRDAAVDSGRDSGSPPRDAQVRPADATMDAPVTARPPCELCDPLASCDPSAAEPRCVCPDGYDDARGDGSQCIDRDECALDTDGCDPHARCTNNAGGFACECNAGWSGDGSSCSDIDECTFGSDDCDGDPDACQNTAGSFTCACPSTHYGSGVGVDGCKIATSMIEAGGSNPGFTCALLATGQVKCWGDNTWGQLGYGDTAARGDAPGEMGDALPALDLGGMPTAISLGGVHACARFDTGAVKCWGANDVGQLGLEHNDGIGDGPGEMGVALKPVLVSDAISAVSAGGDYTCAQMQISMKCWGNNRYGQLGLGDTDRRGDSPGDMDPALPMVDIGGGLVGLPSHIGLAYHTCVRMIGGSLKCWGAGGFGKLGQGNADTLGDASNEMGANLQPIALGAGRYATSVASGYNHTCALLDDRSVKCWGQNGGGQLGLGDTANRGDAAGEMGDGLEAVPLGGPASAVAAGFLHSCAILDGGSVKCWGLNTTGALGLGDTNPRGDVGGTKPDKVPTVDLGTSRTAKQISVGPFHTCALLDNGGVKCWGSNDGGELGLGNQDERGVSAGQMGDALPYVDLGH